MQVLEYIKTVYPTLFKDRSNDGAELTSTCTLENSNRTATSSQQRNIIYVNLAHIKQVGVEEDHAGWDEDVEK